MALVVASIDFGTTFSGWAYSFIHDHQNNPTDVKSKNWNAGNSISSKAPTCVLINADGKTVEAFGYEAEDKYAELAVDQLHRNYYYFQTFKTKLYTNEGNIGQSTVLEDETGKELKALTVFSLTIKYLVDDLMESLNKQISNGVDKNDINWVLTVPAIWNEHAKQFMRSAAREAGIQMGHLSLALEPEAASIYCRHVKMAKTEGSSSADISTLKSGTRYLVCDAGGGTVDITVHEVTQDMKLKEIEKSSGGAWGGTKVNDAYEKFIDTLAGGSVMQVLKEKHMDDFMDVMRSFEIKKRECKPASSGNVVLRFPATLNDVVQSVTGKTFREQVERSPHKSRVQLIKDKLRCDASLVASLFDGPVTCIVNHLTTLLSKYSGNPIEYIVLVGGFSESPLLQEAVKKAFPGKHVTIPQDAGLVVMKGAVMFGHNKRQIVSRVARFTYGIKTNEPYNPLIHSPEREIKTGASKGRVDNRFYKIVEIGQSIPTDEKAGERLLGEPLKGDGYDITLFASTDIKPSYVDDKGCLNIGSFYVNCKDRKGNLSGTKVSMYFGGTEIEVKVELITTGVETTATFDLPE